MNTAKLIEGMIPDELRLAPHPDAALVNEAIATVLTAMDESDALTLAGKSRDVRKALLAFYNGTYVKHIAEEDELWTSMQAKAEKYRPEAHLITTRPMKGGFSRYSYTMDNEKGTIVVMHDDGKYVAEYMVFGTDIPVASAAMDSEREALASLFMGRGALVVIDGSPLIPLPAKVPVIEETATETVTEEPAHPPIAESINPGPVEVPAIESDSRVAVCSELKVAGKNTSGEPNAWSFTFDYGDGKKGRGTLRYTPRKGGSWSTGASGKYSETVSEDTPAESITSAVRLAAPCDDVTLPPVLPTKQSREV